MIIMKFGGSSVENCEAINRVISIVKGRLPRRPVVVVSALKGITDALYRIADFSQQGDIASAQREIESIRRRHVNLANELINVESFLTLTLREINHVCDDLTTLVKAVCTLGELTDRSKAKIISNGEWLSSKVIWQALNANGIITGFADARQMIITNNDYLNGKPNLSEIEARAPKEIAKAGENANVVITQGFISSDIKGETTVLGRGGSDLSASLLGMALNAEAIEIWTDVDGVKTADPRRVTNTKRLEKISFEEAAEMAHFGAKVLHPLTIEPAVMKNIPVYVLNSGNPSGQGTAILSDDNIDEGVKSLSFKDNIVMLNIFSTGMIDVPGFLCKVFQIFADNGVSVDLISTSEANISLTVDPSPNLNVVIEQLSQFTTVKAHYDKAQVSIIGKHAVNQRGLMLWAMKSINTDIYMISQGTSLINMSYVIDAKELDVVLQELHKYLFEY